MFKRSLIFGTLTAGLKRKGLLYPLGCACVVACCVLAFLPHVLAAEPLEPFAVHDVQASAAAFVPPAFSTQTPRSPRSDRAVRIAAPTFYGGFLIPNRNLHGQFFTVESAGTSIAGLEYADHRYPERGLWVGLYETIAVTRPADIEFVLQAWCMVPSSVAASTRYRFSGNSLESGVSWRCSATAYSLDASMLFSWQKERPEFSQIFGVRYDHYSRRLSDPEHVPVGVVPWPASANDTVELGVNTWAPYIGLQMCYAYSDSVAFFRLIGAPIVFGSVAYDEFWRGGAGQHVGSTFAISKGLFAEFFGSVQTHVSDSASVGFFLKMDSVSAYGSGDLDVDPPTGQSAPYRLTYRQLKYLFGVNFALRFRTPSLEWL